MAVAVSFGGWRPTPTVPVPDEDVLDRVGDRVVVVVVDEARVTVPLSPPAMYEGDLTMSMGISSPFFVAIRCKRCVDSDDDSDEMPFGADADVDDDGGGGGGETPLLDESRRFISSVVIRLCVVLWFQQCVHFHKRRVDLLLLLGVREATILSVI